MSSMCKYDSVFLLHERDYTHLKELIESGFSSYSVTCTYYINTIYSRMQCNEKIETNSSAISEIRI